MTDFQKHNQGRTSLLSPLAKGCAHLDNRGRVELPKEHHGKKMKDHVTQGLKKGQKGTVHNKQSRSKSVQIVNFNHGDKVSLPKTYLTRKGALCLFSSNDSSHHSSESHRRHSMDNIDAYIDKLGTLQKFAKSVLHFGDQNYDPYENDIHSEDQFALSYFMQQGVEQTGNEGLQPGADFNIYLRDVISRTSVRSCRTSSNIGSNMQNVNNEKEDAVQTLDNDVNNTNYMVAREERKGHARCRNQLLTADTNNLLKDCTRPVSQTSIRMPNSRTGSASSSNARYQVLNLQKLLDSVTSVNHLDLPTNPSHDSTGCSPVYDQESSTASQAQGPQPLTSPSKSAEGLVSSQSSHDTLHECNNRGAFMGSNNNATPCGIADRFNSKQWQYMYKSIDYPSSFTVATKSDVVTEVTPSAGSLSETNEAPNSYKTDTPSCTSLHVCDDLSQNDSMHATNYAIDLLENKHIKHVPSNSQRSPSDECLGDVSHDLMKKHAYVDDDLYETLDPDLLEEDDIILPESDEEHLDSTPQVNIDKMWSVTAQRSVQLPNNDNLENVSSPSSTVKPLSTNGDNSSSRNGQLTGPAIKPKVTFSEKEMRNCNKLSTAKVPKRSGKSHNNVKDPNSKEIKEFTSDNLLSDTKSEIERLFGKVPKRKGPKLTVADIRDKTHDSAQGDAVSMVPVKEPYTLKDNAGNNSVEEFELETQVDKDIKSSEQKSKRKSTRKKMDDVKKKKAKEKKIADEEKEALKESKRLEKQKREEEVQQLEELIKQKEEEQKRSEDEANEKQKEIEEELARLAAEEEEVQREKKEAVLLLAAVQKTEREERELRRKADLARKKEEVIRRREREKEMAEHARRMEQEMLERISDAQVLRAQNEQERLKREEEEELEQDALEEELREIEHKEREETERMAEIEKQVEDEAMARIYAEQAEIERQKREVVEEARMIKEREEMKRRHLLEEQLSLEAEQRQKDEEEKQLKQMEKMHLHQLQKAEDDARLKMRQDIERKTNQLMARREVNLDRRRHLNGIRQSQGLTKPWVFSYFVLWPRESYQKWMGIQSQDQKSIKGNKKSGSGKKSKS